jgi:uncharacterized protein YgbK (DUF1537 family)
VIILADDLSGAAEVAGICRRFGRDLALSLDSAATGGEASKAEVIDTETRGLAPAEAAAAARRLCPAVLPSQVYKKTDSVLRGPVRAEIEAAMLRSGARLCLLVPCNPSRGRTIRDGVYYVDGTPLADSEFGLDPTSPARTSRVLDLLGPGELPTVFVAPGDALPASGIVVGGAETTADMADWARRLDETTLAAGAADFLAAILEVRGGEGGSLGAARQDAAAPPLPDGAWLLVSGSRSETSHAALAALEARAVPVIRVPAADPGSSWQTGAARALSGAARGALAIDRAASAEDPAQLLAALCGAAAAIVASREPAVLLVEGGATAAALARRLEWTRFSVDGELAPGVVVLRPRAAPHVRFVLKPGSYRWPPAVLTELGARTDVRPAP